MSILLPFFFMIFVLKVSIKALKFGLGVATGFIGILSFLFAGVLFVALFSVVIGLFRMLIPAIVVTGIVLLIVHFVKKNKEELC